MQRGLRESGLSMKVKNHSTLPVQVGRELIPGGQVREVEDRYLYQPRTIRLKEKGILEFLCCGESTVVTMDVVTEVGPPKDEAVVEEPPVEEPDLVVTEEKS